MGIERCELDQFGGLVEEQILDHNNDDDDGNNINNTTNHEKQDHPIFLPNGVCNNERFLQIPTTTTLSVGNEHHDDLMIPGSMSSSSSTHLLELESRGVGGGGGVVKNTSCSKDTSLLPHIYGKGCSSTSTSSNNNNNNNSGTGTGTAAINNNNKEQDRFLPIANVGRIMKKFIPGNGKISKDAKETVQECVSEFISFVTGEASDKCLREKRKTINGDDIIWAITTLGFEQFVIPLKHYLTKYRELEGEKLNLPKQQQRTNNVAGAGDHHHFHHQEQKPSIPNNMYPSPSLPSQTTFVPSNDPRFPMPFQQTSNIQTRLTQHEHIDSLSNW